MAAPKKKAKASWQDKAQQLAENLCKRSKDKKAALLILTHSGDLVMKAGKADKLDPTAIGALATAARGLRSELDERLGLRTKKVLCCDAKKQYWIEEVGSWIVMGVQINETTSLKDFFKHLKKKSAQEGGTAEALDGLSADAVDFAIESGSN